MARNKHPEETVSLILDVAGRLFMEKGYEYTSIQDIIDNLGGLSKGAIYHHFRSKEEILIAVMDRMTEESNRMLGLIRDRSGISGKEKLKAIFKESVARPVQEDVFTTAPDLGNNPRLLYSLFKETMAVAAPDYIQPIIEEGIADGSLSADHPRELAELIILVANIWMNPMIFGDSVDRTCGKISVFRQMMAGFGLDIVDDEIMERMRELAVAYQKNR